MPSTIALREFNKPVLSFTSFNIDNSSLNIFFSLSDVIVDQMVDSYGLSYPLSDAGRALILKELGINQYMMDQQCIVQPDVFSSCKSLLLFIFTKTAMVCYSFCLSGFISGGLSPKTLLNLV